jgi:hypothetical protein
MAKPKELPIRRLTPQKVRAVLWAAGLPEYNSAGAWWSPGFFVGRTRNGAIPITHDLGWTEEFRQIAAALTAAGIVAEVRDEAVWVPVDQGIASL